MEDYEFEFHILEARKPYSGRQGVPHVLISGAGPGGLMLAILLEKADISYEILERSKELARPLGSVMSLSGNILPVFEQLGLYDELLNFAKPINALHFLDSSLKKIGEIMGTDSEEKDLIGYNRLVFARPDLYDLLLAKVPAHKISMNKKVVAMIQNDQGVAVRCQDKSIYVADILVGADGAHSGVRQTLYRRLQDTNILPECDSRTMSKGYLCLVGVTKPLDPSRYPELRHQYSDAALMVADNSPYSWSTFVISGDRVCWNVIIQLTAKQSEDEQFRGSQWDPESNETMIKQVAHFRTPYGSMGDLFAVTPREAISRVLLEDILYQTWHHERTVLIGDACHKLLPSTGQGCVNAMQDAVVLANCLYEMKSMAFEDIEEALHDFREQRFIHAKTQYDATQWSAKLMYGHTIIERVLRQVVFNLMPRSMLKSRISKDSAYRPQVSFLPQTPNRGTIPPLPQKPSAKYAAHLATVLIEKQ
ncbi:hypothetical protein BG011_009868 [Mortierella polycephala]|uniref:FAD-binding domain-containing protein n=1 Tax=Mortierella polycephala TaxID=41804 RepID=A0A9P6PMD8_9FUNG|nr:hypothetical protein BG011_009868 [Mortierella polycephala]